MAITTESKGSHNLSMRWETTEFSVPIKTKP